MLAVLSRFLIGFSLLASSGFAMNWGQQGLVQEDITSTPDATVTPLSPSDAAHQQAVQNICTMLEQHVQLMSQVRDEAPETAQPALERVQARLQQRLQLCQTAFDEGTTWGEQMRNWHRVRQTMTPAATSEADDTAEPALVGPRHTPQTNGEGNGQGNGQGCGQGPNPSCTPEPQHTPQPQSGANQPQLPVRQPDPGHGDDHGAGPNPAQTPVTGGQLGPGAGAGPNPEQTPVTGGQMGPGPGNGSQPPATPHPAHRGK